VYKKNNEVGTNAAVPYLRPRSYLSPFYKEKEVKCVRDARVCMCALAGQARATKNLRIDTSQFFSREKKNV